MGYEQALKGIVPDKILFDRPKLGHSVPMKNWMRETLEIQQWMRETLLEGWLQTGNFFNAAFTQQMLQEHLLKTHNHSHRLWSLLVLELWMREHFQN